MNAFSERGEIALHCACYTGNMKAFRLLLSHPDINLDARTDPSQIMNTPLWIARNNCEMLECLLDPQACGISIDYSLTNKDKKNTEIKQLKYHKGANIKIQDGWGGTMIHYAVSNSEAGPFLLELAIKYGSNLNAMTDYGDTPLILATVRDRQSIEVLLKNGANMNQKNGDGKTVIVVAFENSSVNAMKALLKYNCDLSTISEETNETPFYKAFKDGRIGKFGDIFFRHFLRIYHNQPGMIGGILDEPVFENGGTAFHVAVQHLCPETVHYLTQINVNPNVKNRKGK